MAKGKDIKLAKRIMRKTMKSGQPFLDVAHSILNERGFPREERGFFLHNIPFLATITPQQQ